MESGICILQISNICPVGRNVCGIGIYLAFKSGQITSIGFIRLKSCNVSFVGRNVRGIFFYCRLIGRNICLVRCNICLVGLSQIDGSIDFCHIRCCTGDYVTRYTCNIIYCGFIQIRIGYSARSKEG